MADVGLKNNDKIIHFRYILIKVIKILKEGELIWDIFQCFILHTRLADEPFSHSFLC